VHDPAAGDMDPAAALFLQLIHGSDWSIPALWTSLATTIIGGGFLGAGLTILKKKCRPDQA
jgi:hypothetical protein